MGNEGERGKRPCDYCNKEEVCYELWRDGDYLRAQWLCLECIKKLRVAALKR